GNRDGLDVLPDGDFLPPMDFNIVEKDLANRLQKEYGGKRHFIMGRTANITRPHHGRVNCEYQNECWLGCNFGAYLSTQSSIQPPAMATVNLTQLPFSIVTRMLYNKDTQKPTGVETVDAETILTYEFHAKVSFVCASAFISTWVLLNSA